MQIRERPGGGGGCDSMSRRGRCSLSPPLPPPRPMLEKDAMFEELVEAVDVPQKRDRPDHEWIWGGTWKLIDQRANLRKQGRLLAPVTGGGAAAHPSHSQGLQRETGRSGHFRRATSSLLEGRGFTQGLRHPPCLAQGVGPCGLQAMMRHTGGPDARAGGPLLEARRSWRTHLLPRQASSALGSGRQPRNPAMKRRARLLRCGERI